MPTKSDWAVARALLILAATAFFGMTWTWQVLLGAAVLMLALIYVHEYLKERFDL